MSSQDAYSTTNNQTDHLATLLRYMDAILRYLQRMDKEQIRSQLGLRQTSFGKNSRRTATTILQQSTKLLGACKTNSKTAQDQMERKPYTTANARPSKVRSTIGDQARRDFSSRILCRAEQPQRFSGKSTKFSGRFNSD
eukprot:gb/GEZN01023276.1/.p1 GENE.gb/GEZN01023276.1/~~gb/GEZN01023276.1/.p1  ORF type:complete len:139 (-),score=14.14 gb/GEZN01023276.1/:34-450(-)